jgi:siderophore ferric iron reductase
VIQARIEDIAIDRSGPESFGALQSLFDAARGRVALLDGTVGPWEPGFIGGSVGEGEALATLLAATRRDFEKGGPAYWATRAWTMLLWQPCALAVLSVHGMAFAVALDRMAQKVDGTLVAGFRLGDAAIVHGSEQDLIVASAARLRHLGDRLYHSLSSLVKLKRLHAERLLADRLLGVLTLQTQTQTQTQTQDRESCERLVQTGEAWLRAAGLSGHSRLVMGRTPSGGYRAVLDRKACCLHYRWEPGNLCASCPKQSDEVRFARLLAEEAAHD